MSERKLHQDNALMPENLIPAFLQRWISSKYTPWFIAVAYIIVIGTIALTFHRIGDYDVETDFYWTYAPSAQSILDGTLVVDDYKGPGYPLLLAFIKIFVGEFFRAGVIISVFSAGMFLLMTMLLLKKVFSQGIAFLVGCALITNTAFVRYSYTASTDMPFAALLMTIIYLTVRNEKIKKSDIILCGIVSGFAYLVRYNAVSLIIAFCFVFFLFNLKKEPVSLRFKGLLLYCIAAFLIILPWMMYLYAKTGDFFYQKNYLNMAYEIYGKGIIGWDQWWTQEAPRFRSFIGVLSHDPIIVLQRMFINLGEHLISDIFWLIGIWWGVLAIGGLYVVARQVLMSRQMAIFVFSGAYFLFLVPFFYSDRFSLPLVPFYVLVAILSLLWIAQKVNNYFRMQLGMLILLGLLGVSLYRTASYNFYQIASGPKEVLEIAEEFKSVLEVRPDNGSVLIARKPHIAYYLGMEFHPIPILGSADELLSYCHTYHIDYVFASYVEVKLRPELSTLLDMEHPPRGFSPVAKTKIGDAVLYRVDGRGPE